jgi:hypothetical protein
MQSFKHLSHARPGAVGLVAVVVAVIAAGLAGATLRPAVTTGSPAPPVAAPRGPVASTRLAVTPTTRPVGPPGAGFGGGAGVASGPGGLAGAGGRAGSAAGVRADLATRLGEILRLRERAYARRDATVLDTIYTWDCACLRSGRAAIARLLADHAVWRGRSVSVRVERLSRVNSSLWIALAVLRRNAFRIEREDGALLRAVPAARQRYRFALVRAGAGTWLLGHASLIEELPT